MTCDSKINFLSDKVCQWLKIDVVLKALHAIVIRWFSLNEASLGLFKFISNYLHYFEKINIFFNIICDSKINFLSDKVCQWLAIGRWFSPVTLVSSTNKTDSHNITEILLKVALNISENHRPIASHWQTLSDKKLILESHVISYVFWLVFTGYSGFLHQ
jgi:hypothetical protein